MKSENSKLIDKQLTLDNELLPHLFRLEFTKMTAVICRHFGLKHIEIAEDIASETFLKATELWGLKGIPENPTAWLYIVAKNKTKDYLKRNSLFENVLSPLIKTESFGFNDIDIEFTVQNIKDSQLEMIFAVCNPVNSEETQISLALQILCGFSLEEIANAFLTNKETIKKRLLRGRETLRNQSFKIKNLTNAEIVSRLDTVLTTLYLLFNEGYFSKSTDSLVRKDLCSEAVRLTLLLAENPLTSTLKVNALLALQCFQSSRFDARTIDEEVILFEEQDRTLWNQTLIDKGNHYLIKSSSGYELSKYHLEASIAYWHTTPDNDKKWKPILQLYDQLIIIAPSPAITLNRIFALAKVSGNEKAILEVEGLNMINNHYYYSLLGYLYSSFDKEKAVKNFRQAISLTKSNTEKNQLIKNISQLEG